MIRPLFFVFFLLLAGNVYAVLPVKNFGYKSCNHHQFNFMFLKVYDSYLCVEDKDFLTLDKIFKADFSLVINYNMNFDKDELSTSSIEEINRYYIIDKQEQSDYYQKLTQIFPNVVKGDVIEAKYNSKGQVRLYHNKIFTGEINDKKFSRIFLDIWLHKDNKYKNMIADLFNQNEQN